MTSDQRTTESSPTSPAPPSLSIFFPMYNEEENILPVLETATEECRLLVADAQISDYEIIVVNDASKDATGELADAAAAADPHIRVVHHDRNRKLGGAMKSGFAASTGDLILYSDGDLPFDMKELHKAVRVQRLYDADIISVYRHDRTTEGLLRRRVHPRLQRAAVGLVQAADPGRQLLVQARATFDLRSHRVAERGQLHRRRTPHPGRAPRVSDRAVRDRLLPRIRGTSTLASPKVILTIISEMRGLRRAEVDHAGSSITFCAVRAHE
ncbi:MAG: glycosyltransferase family 2 protein [Ilumatobacteraceae bacterium]